jgi:type III secretory pathway component EscS
VWAIRLAVLLGVLLTISYAFDKTLWDWLKLLIVPAVIAVGATWFNKQQRERAS